MCIRDSIYFNEIDGVDMSLSQLPHVHLLFTTCACRMWSVSYTHLRAHETSQDIVCRLLLEKKKMETVPDNTEYAPAAALCKDWTSLAILLAMSEICSASAVKVTR